MNKKVVTEVTMAMINDRESWTPFCRRNDNGCLIFEINLLSMGIWSISPSSGGRVIAVTLFSVLIIGSQILTLEKLVDFSTLFKESCI